MVVAILRIHLGISGLSFFSTELTIYVTEKSIVGGSHRLSARNLFVNLQSNQVSEFSVWGEVKMHDDLPKGRNSSCVVASRNASTIELIISYIRLIF